MKLNTANGKEALFYIRDVCADDAEELLAVYSHYVLNTAVSFEYELPGEEEFRGRVVNTLLK